MIQCEHEYVMDGGIDLFKFDSQWFHQQSFDKHFPTMATVFPMNAGRQSYNALPAPLNAGIHGTDEPMPNDDNKSYPPDADEECTLGSLDQPLNDGDDQAQLDDPMDEGVLVDVSNKENFMVQLTQIGETVSYQHIMEKYSELACTCQNDQTKMRSLLANLHCMKERVRDGKDIFAHFDTAILNLPSDSTTTDINQPRNAVSRPVPNSTSVKRKKSGNEYHSNSRGFNSRHQKNYRKTVTLSQMSNSNDDTFLPPPNVKSRSCTICRQKGHGQGRCPFITKFGTTPLEKGNESARQRLSKNLSIMTTYELEMRCSEDVRPILKELPALKEIKGLVIHKRILGNTALYNPYTPENICLECTVLHLNGVEHPSYTQQLFNVDCISSYIIRNKVNIIMSQLQESSGIQHLQQPPLTQLTQDSTLLTELDRLDSHI